MFISGARQSDSGIHIPILFPNMLLWNTELSSLGSTVGPCGLSSLYIVVHIVNPKLLNWPLNATVVSVPQAWPAPL